MSHATVEYGLSGGRTVLWKPPLTVSVACRRAHNRSRRRTGLPPCWIDHSGLGRYS